MVQPMVTLLHRLLLAHRVEHDAALVALLSLGHTHTHTYTHTPQTSNLKNPTTSCLGDTAAHSDLPAWSTWLLTGLNMVQPWWLC